MGINEREGIIFEQPTTMDQRVEIANTCELRLEMSVPMLVDGMTNEVDAAYSALPDRIYLIDGDGRGSYRSERGPMGFRPDEFEESIKRCLLDPESP